MLLLWNDVYKRIDSYRFRLLNGNNMSPEDLEIVKNKITEWVNKSGLRINKPFLDGEFITGSDIVSSIIRDALYGETYGYIALNSLFKPIKDKDSNSHSLEGIVDLGCYFDLVPCNNDYLVREANEDGSKLTHYTLKGLAVDNKTYFPTFCKTLTCRSDSSLENKNKI